MREMTRKLFIVLLSILMVFGMSQLNTYTSFAEDEKTDELTTQNNESLEDERGTDDSSEQEESSTDAKDTKSEETQKEEKKEEEVTQESESQTEEKKTEETVKETDTKKTYTYENKNMKVTAVLTDASAISDKAELRVTRVTSTSKGYNYQAYMSALNKDSDYTHDTENTLLYDIAFMLDGKEIEPEKGKVKVSIDFKKDQLTLLGITKASDLEVKHLPIKDSIIKKYDSTKDAMNIKASHIETEDMKAKVSVKNETVSFTTDSFSVFSVGAYEYETNMGMLANLKVNINFEDSEGNPVTPSLDGYYYLFIDALAEGADDNEWTRRFNIFKIDPNSSTFTVNLTDSTGAGDLYQVASGKKTWNESDQKVNYSSRGTNVTVTIKKTKYELQSLDLDPYTTKNYYNLLKNNDSNTVESDIDINGGKLGEFTLSTDDENVEINTKDNKSFDIKAVSAPKYKLTTTVKDGNNETSTFNPNDGNNYYVLVEVKKNGTSYYQIQDISSESITLSDNFYDNNGSEKGKISVDSTDEVTAYIVTKGKNKPSVGEAVNGWDSAKKYASGTSVAGYSFTATVENNQIKVELKENEKFTTTVNFYDFDSFNDDDDKTMKQGASLVDDPNLKGEYSVLAELRDKTTDKLVGYAWQKINNESSNTVTFQSFKDASDPWNDNAKIDYDSSKYTVTTRLKHVGNVNQYSDIVNASEEIEVNDGESFHFVKNIYDGNTSTINLEKTYGAELQLKIKAPEDTTISADDKYYIFVEVEHENTGSTYHLEPLEINGDTEKVITVTDWYDSNGNKKSDEKYTGNEKGVKVKVIKSTQNLTSNNIKDIVDGKNFSDVKSGSSVKNYTITYTGEVNKQNNSETKKTEYIYEFDLSKVDATNDYTYKDILGAGVFYGITAEVLEHNNDLETNFAVNKYISTKGQGVNPDLSGTSTGTIVVAEIEEGSTMKVSYKGDKKVPVFVGEDDADKVLGDDNDAHIVKIESDKDYLTDNIVDPILNHGKTISDQMKNHAINYTPEKYYTDGSLKTVVVDTTAYPDDATIYIDADEIAEAIAKTGNGKDDGLVINKKSGQMIIFTYDSTSDIKIGKYGVNTENTTEPILTTTTESGNQSDHNRDVDKEIAQKIVWNCTGECTVKIGNTAGLFLAPDATDFSIADSEVGSSCAGWIITGGKAHNDGGEFHNVYSTLTETDVTDLLAQKTVDGKKATANQKFAFSIEHYKTQGNETGWKKLDKFKDDIENDGGQVEFIGVNEFENGWNVYRITETGQSQDTEGNYTLDTNVYYAVVKATVITDVTTETSLITVLTPSYYSDFDESLFERDSTELKGLSNKLENGVTFVNATASDAETSITFNGTKTYEHGTLTDNLFTFKVKEGSNPVATGKSKANGKIAFTSITYTLDDLDGETSKKFIYTITEDIPEEATVANNYTVNGVKYDPTVRTVTVIVTNNDGTLSASIEDGSDTISFTNGKEMETTIELEATKAFNGTWGEKEFFFRLTPDNDSNDAGVISPMPLKTDGSEEEAEKYTVKTTEFNKKATFGTITYKATGTYRYIIKEIPAVNLENNNKKNGITYDVAEHHVVVTVSEEDNQLVATAKYDNNDSLTIFNEYDAEGDAEIQVTKAFDDDAAWNFADTFTFKIDGKTEADKATLPDTKTVTTTKSEKTKIFDKIKYTLDDLDGKTNKTFTYIVKEIEPDEADKIKGVTYTTESYEVQVKVTDNGAGVLDTEVTYPNNKPLVIENKYKADDIEVTLKAKKDFNDWDAKDAEGGFKFELAGVGTDKLPATTTAIVNKDSDTAEFGPIKYTLVDLEDKVSKIYTYTITETDIPSDEKEDNNYTLNGITYDPNPHTVTVKVEDEGGKLKATVTYDDGGDNAIITNTYNYEETTAHFEVTKAMSDEGWAAASDKNVTFTFELIDKGNNVDGLGTNPMPTGNTAETNAKDVKAVFGDITFTKPGEYNYMIKEKLPPGANEDNNYTVDGISYDTQEHNVLVKVTDDKEGKLVATVTYGNAQNLEVTNTYGVEGNATIEVTKKASKETWRAAENKTFTFVLADNGNNVTDLNTNPMPSETEVSVTNTNLDTESLKATFGTIIYKKAGEYNYTLTEKLPDNIDGNTKDGITYDNKSYDVVVTVTDNYDGTFTTDVKYDDSDNLTITNTYTAADIDVQLEATKETTAAGWVAKDSYDFKLYESDKNTVIDTKSAKKDKPAQFDKLTYKLSDLDGEESKTFTYYIKEDVPADKKGITYDETYHEVTVKITDNKNGTLSSEVKYDGNDDLVIKNSYDASGTIQLHATKKVNNNLAWEIVDKFEFVLLDKDDKLVDTQFADKDHTTVNFEELTFGLDQVGKHTYYIQEKLPEGETGTVYKNITYDTTKYKVEVNVEDNKDGTLNVTATYPGNKDLVVTNTINDSIDVELEATKAFDNEEGWDAISSFDFTISGTEKMPAKTTETATKDNPAKFDKITYTLSDLGDETSKTFNYTIKEEVPDDTKGITYDTEDHTVQVTISLDTETGKLKKNVIYDNGSSLTITNKYATTGSINLKATKSINNWTNKNAKDGFTFRLYKEDGETEIDSQTATETKKTVEFKTLDYDLSDVGKTFNYVIKEDVPSDTKGITYDTEAHNVVVKVEDKHDGTLAVTATYDGESDLTITNKYAAKTSINLEATKVFDYWKTNPDQTFTFNLGGDETDTQTVDSEQPVAKFKTIEYKLEDAGKTFNYTITEEVPDDTKGITYDTKTHKVSVKVVDNGDGTLTATPTYDGKESLTIVNKYEAEGDITLQATKSYNGWDEGLKDTFTFNLSGEGIDQDVEVSSDNPIATFDVMSYTLKDVGEHHYTIHEVIPDNPDSHITYDDTEYDVTVNVEDDGDGTLTVSAMYDGSNDLTITNTYTEKKESYVDARIKVKKTFIGRKWTKKDKFSFTLKAIDNAPLPDNTELVIGKPNNGESHTLSFDSIRFTKAGMYEYIVTEVDGGIDNVIYDTSEHKVTFTVIEKDGELVLDDSTAAIQTEEFINEYFSKKKKTTKTGDDTNIFAYLSLSISSLLLILLMNLKKRFN